MKTEPRAIFTTIGTPAQGLTGATLGFFIGFAAVSLFGPTAKSLKGILGLSPLEVGFLVAAPSLSGDFRLSVAAEILMAIGMGVANAAVFKLVAQEIPEAVGGAAGWVGGLGAFGGFAIPPLMGTIVQVQGTEGYANGFVVFICLAAISLLLVGILKRKRAKVLAFPN